MVGITWQCLSRHNKIDDLWIAIEGRAYDVTHWSKVHPGGGLVLLHFAGKDATQQFLANHPEDVKSRLSGFYKGPMDSLGANMPSKAGHLTF